LQDEFQKVMAQQNARSGIAFGVVLGIFLGTRIFVVGEGKLGFKIVTFLLVMLICILIGYLVGH